MASVRIHLAKHPAPGNSLGHRHRLQQDPDLPLAPADLHGPAGDSHHCVVGLLQGAHVQGPPRRALQGQPRRTRLAESRAGAVWALQRHHGRFQDRLLRRSRPVRVTGEDRLPHCADSLCDDPDVRPVGPFKRLRAAAEEHHLLWSDVGLVHQPGGVDDGRDGRVPPSDRVPHRPSTQQLLQHSSRTQLLLTSAGRRQRVRVQPGELRGLREGLLLPVPLQHRVQPLRLSPGLRHVEERRQADGPPPPQPPSPLQPVGRPGGAGGGLGRAGGRSGDVRGLRGQRGPAGAGREGGGSGDALHREHRGHSSDVRGRSGGLRPLPDGQAGAGFREEPYEEPGRGTVGRSLAGPVLHLLLHHRGGAGLRSHGPGQRAQPGQLGPHRHPAVPAERLPHQGPPPGALQGHALRHRLRQRRGGAARAGEAEQLHRAVPHAAPPTDAPAGPTLLEEEDAEGDLCLPLALQHHPLDHPGVWRSASVRQQRGLGDLRLPDVGGRGEHRDAVRNLLPDALGGQSVRGLLVLLNAAHNLHLYIYKYTAYPSHLFLLTETTNVFSTIFLLDMVMYSHVSVRVKTVDIVRLMIV